jgi:hypothetical protein
MSYFFDATNNKFTKTVRFEVLKFSGYAQYELNNIQCWSFTFLLNVNGIPNLGEGYIPALQAQTTQFRILHLNENVHLPVPLSS